MINEIKQSLATLFSRKGSKRGNNIKKNAMISLVVMLFSNITGFLLVPIVIGFLDLTKYGIWLTVNSILAWVFLFDLGLGGGLRTRLAQAVASKDIEHANILINTSYVFMSILILIISIIFYLVSPHINWVSVFNAPPAFQNELSRMMLVIVVFFLLRFVFQLINGLFTAMQRNSVSNIINFLSQLLALVTILAFAKLLNGSLFWIGFIYSAAPLVVFIVFTIVFFRTYKQFSLNIRYVKFNVLKSIMGIGLYEFLDQIAFIVLMSATNLIISQVTSPAEVVPYQITMRMFGMFLTVYTLSINPLTPAFTEAYTLGEMKWIKKVLHKANLLFFVCAAAMLSFVPLAKFVFSILVRNKAEVSYTLIFAVVAVTMARMFGAVYSKFLTGCGKVRLLAISSICCATIYIFVIIHLGSQNDIGVIGVILAQLSVGMFSMFIAVKQSNKIIRGEATGIWAK